MATEDTASTVTQDLIDKMTAEISTSLITSRALEITAIGSTIKQVRGEVIKGLSTEPESPADAPRPEPAVPIKKSVTPDYIVCLEDGKQLKMLRRHLQSAYKMSPEQYRARWGLDDDYPMVAPNYSEQRSSLAKKSGLGSKPRTPKALKTA
jgi:predicted transcriptional regulator